MSLTAKLRNLLATLGDIFWLPPGAMPPGGIALQLPIAGQPDLTRR